MKQARKTRRAHMPREEIRKANGAAKKRRRKSRYMLYYIILAIILLSTGIVLSLTVFFNITEITVQNSGQYAQQEIIQQSGVQIGNNLIRAELGKIENNICNNCVYLDAVHANRDFPSTLRIDCEPAAVTYSYQTNDGSYVYLSQAGRVLEVGQPSFAADTITITGVSLENLQRGEFVDLSQASVKEIRSLKEKAQNAGLADITGINITGENSVELLYQNRITICIDNVANADYDLQLVSNIIQQYIGPVEHGRIFRSESDKSFHFLAESS